jgi:hypothetical protein
MSYKTALRVAGATVLEFESFGSYQGEWYALVEYNGERGWVSGYFGSCSYCDSFEREFGYSESFRCEEHEYRYDDSWKGCPACEKLEADYDFRLIDFGKTYLETLLPAEHYLRLLNETAEWDSEAVVAAGWICEMEKKYV